MLHLRPLSVSVLVLVLAACSDSAKAPAASVATITAVTGVADCDQFLSAYEQCLSDKVPAASRDAMMSGIAQWKTAWHDMAANAATKDMLPQICKQARDASRAAMQAYDCAL